MKTARKITALVLTLMMLLGTLAAGTVTASAENSGTCGKNGDDVRWSLNPETGVLTISGKGEMEDYNFDNDFYPGWYDVKITSVVIENGVESIGDYAFAYCYSLTSITIPSSVTSIGDWAFAYCYSLKSVTIPSSVTSIGYEAFCSCSSLTSITIPSSVTSIGKMAFVGCAHLSEIKVDSASNSFCTVDGVLFSKDKKTLVGYPAGKQGTSYTIPSSVTSIGEAAFANCYSLTSITIPSSVTSIGDEAFYFCSSLISVTIPSSVTSIGDWAFYSCSSLISVTIPSSVTSIGYKAFAHCDSLTSITIPSSVTSIGDWAFADCPEDLVIKCEKGSAADTYARLCNINTNYTTKSSAYKVDVTVSVPVKAPAGAEVWIDGSKAEGSNGRYSKHIGQLESDKSITVQIKYDGNVLETYSVKVTVDSGFFAKIASFFSNFLFNGFKWKSETINF